MVLPLYFKIRQKLKSTTNVHDYFQMALPSHTKMEQSYLLYPQQSTTCTDLARIRCLYPKTKTSNCADNTRKNMASGYTDA
jgi:hypothetical protein